MTESRISTKWYAASAIPSLILTLAGAFLSGKLLDKLETYSVGSTIIKRSNACNLKDVEHEQARMVMRKTTRTATLDVVTEQAQIAHQPPAESQRDDQHKPGDENLKRMSPHDVVKDADQKGEEVSRGRTRHEPAFPTVQRGRSPDPWGSESRRTTSTAALAFRTVSAASEVDRRLKLIRDGSYSRYDAPSRWNLR